MVQNGTEIEKIRPAAVFLPCPFHRGPSPALQSCAESNSQLAGEPKWNEMVQNGTEIEKIRPAAVFLPCPFHQGSSPALHLPTRRQSETGQNGTEWYGNRKNSARCRITSLSVPSRIESCAPTPNSLASRNGSKRYRMVRKYKKFLKESNLEWPNMAQETEYPPNWAMPASPLEMRGNERK